MAWLQSHQLRLQRKQIASQQTLEFSVVAAITPNKATKIKQRTPSLQLNTMDGPGFEVVVHDAWPAPA